MVIHYIQPQYAYIDSSCHAAGTRRHKEKFKRANYLILIESISNYINIFTLDNLRHKKLKCRYSTKVFKGDLKDCKRMGVYELMTFTLLTRSCALVSNFSIK
jgi:hypothetical protein